VGQWLKRLSDKQELMNLNLIGAFILYHLGGTFKYFKLELSPSQDENAALLNFLKKGGGGSVLLVHNEVLVRNVIHYVPVLLPSHHLQVPT
jgi:hypothetical protein